MTATTGASSVSWLDFPFDARKPWYDREWTGLGFLPIEQFARQRWSDFWPTGGNPPNWDAIGTLTVDGHQEWLLVEAKAHIGEIESSCGAREHGGRPKIEAALADVKSDLNVDSGADWLNGYYQYANRIAVLWHLLNHHEPARLLFIYFVGDSFPDKSIDCPADQAGWEEALLKQNKHLGLPLGHPLESRMHKLFLPVAGFNSTS